MRGPGFTTSAARPVLTGPPAGGYATRRGNAWTKQSIYDLLTLPLHRGNIGFHVSQKARSKGYLDGLEGAIEPIFTADLAARIDAKLGRACGGAVAPSSPAAVGASSMCSAASRAGPAGCARPSSTVGRTPNPRYHHPGEHADCSPERQSYAQADYIRHLADFWAQFRFSDEVCDQVLAKLAADEKGRGDGRCGGLGGLSVSADRTRRCGGHFQTMGNWASVGPARLAGCAGMASRTRSRPPRLPTGFGRSWTTMDVIATTGPWPGAA